MVKFPNVSKVVVDCRGLGDAFPVFMSQPWVDPETNKEYPPIVSDSEPSLIHGAVPLLREVIANNALNHQMVSATTIALEQHSLEIPVRSKNIVDDKIVISTKEDDDKVVTEETKHLTMHEKAIYLEADALQIEMGNIVAKETSSGAIVYDVAKGTQHKDRYSALGMALTYISEIEDERKKRLVQLNSVPCIGIVTRF